MWQNDFFWGSPEQHGAGWIRCVPVGETLDTSFQYGTNAVQVDPEECEVMQFTGLKDSKGVEIYEGDIVRGAWSDDLQAMLVLYQAPAFVMKTAKRNKTWASFIMHPDEQQNYVVIGNIHEHPELIK